MDMSQHPQTETSSTQSGQKSNPGEGAAFLLALVLLGALGAGFFVSGLAGLTLVMVALVPVIYIVLVTISVGR